MYQNKVFNHPSTTPSHPLGYKTRKSTQTACCHDINSNCVNRISEMDDVWMNLIISPPYLFLINLNQFDSSIFRTLIMHNLRLQSCSSFLILEFMSIFLTSFKVMMSSMYPCGIQAIWDYNSLRLNIQSFFRFLIENL